MTKNSVVIGRCPIEGDLTQNAFRSVLLEYEGKKYRAMFLARGFFLEELTPNMQLSCNSWDVATPIHSYTELSALSWGMRRSVVVANFIATLVDADILRIGLSETDKDIIQDAADNYLLAMGCKLAS